MTKPDCLTADMLAVGMRHQTKMRFTREQVEQYGALSGDDNAIKGFILKIDISIDDMRGNRIGGGQSQLIAPDEVYRQWWKKQ